MNKRLERVLKEYKHMLAERTLLLQQLSHFKGLTAEEVIESMFTPQMDGERVQTSKISDKTATIALTYHERMEQLNREWYEHLESKYAQLDEEIKFFEAAIDSLPEDLAPLMHSMVVENQTWDALSQAFHMGRTTIHRLRKKAVGVLSGIYDQHDKDTLAYILS